MLLIGLIGLVVLIIVDRASSDLQFFTIRGESGPSPLSLADQEFNAKFAAEQGMKKLLRDPESAQFRNETCTTNRMAVTPYAAK